MAFNSGEFLQCKLPNGKILNLYIPKVKTNLTNGQTINLANFKNRIVELVDRKPLTVLGGFVFLDNNLGNINKISNVIANNQYSFEYAWRNFVDLPKMYKQILTIYNDGGYALIFNDYMKNDYNTSYQYLTCPILVDGVQTNYNIYIRYKWTRSTNPNGNSNGFYDSQYGLNTPYPTPATKPQYYYTPTIQFSFNSQSSWLGSANGDVIVRDHDTGKIFVISPQPDERIMSSNTGWYTVLDNTVEYATISASQFKLTDVSGVVRFNLAYAYDRTSYFSTEIKNIINDNLEIATPYDPNGTAETSVTSGTYDGSSDSIDLTSTPTDDVLSSDLLKAYLPDSTVLSNLHSYLFSSSFVDNIIKSLNNPFETIIKLFTLPISITGASDTIKLGNLDSGITCDRTTSRYIDVNVGTVSIDGYYGLFNDYNTKITLYLPFLNCIDLNVDDVINGTISVIYRVDIMTGDFVAIVKANKTNARGFEYDSIIFTGGGNMASEIPLTQSNTMGLIGSLNSGLQNVQTGNILGSFVSGVSVNVPQTSYSVKGGLSSNSGFLSRLKPYIRLQIDNVVLPANFKHLVGFKTAVTGSIGSFSGFAKFKSFDFEIGTNEETNIIKNHLQNGIFVENGSNAPTPLTNGIYLLSTTDDDRTCGKTFTTIDSITGVNKSEFLINNRNIMIEYTGNIDNVNYLYDSDLGRFYFVRQKSIVKNGLYNLLLECDLLQTFADSIKNLVAVCERSETNYNALLLDPEIPRQIDNIVKYIDFGSGFTSFTNVLIAI